MRQHICEDHMLNLLRRSQTHRRRPSIHLHLRSRLPRALSQERVHGQDNGLSISTKHCTVEESGAIEAVLVNTNQFYKWFTDLEAAMKSEYQHYLTSLTERIQTCDGILHQVDETLDLFNELQLQHQAVATKTKTLHDACDRLLIEKQRLIEFAEALRSKLKYFDELENVATNFYSPNMNVANGNFLPLLKRLDECISYVESNPQYAESSVYLVKFRQLQSRALGMIRSHVLSVLKNTSSQVQAAIRSSSGSKTAVSEGVEASVIYVRFKAAASELKPVLEEIESRSPRKEYAQILAECHKLYCEQRLSLVKGIVHQRISEFAKKEKLPSLTRSGCAYLMQQDDHHSEHAGDSSNCHNEWLVKWCGLDYEHATWELENASFLHSPQAQNLIREYENRHQRAKEAASFVIVDKIFQVNLQN